MAGTSIVKGTMGGARRGHICSPPGKAGPGFNPDLSPSGFHARVEDRIGAEGRARAEARD